MVSHAQMAKWHKTLATIAGELAIALAQRKIRLAVIQQWAMQLAALAEEMKE